MFIAYIDESGNTGEIAKGGTNTYTLGCVTLEAQKWPQAADQFGAFRDRIAKHFGVPEPAEIKANYLIHNGGDLRPLGLNPNDRYVLYRAHMRILHDLEMQAFAVVIDKRKRNLHGQEVFDLAWETLLQRLERKSYYESTPFLIFHDEGEAAEVRRWCRYARKNLTAGSKYGYSLNVAATKLIEDPIPSNSRECKFIQLADLVAYAGFRKHIPPGPNAAGTVCPATMWDEIGQAINGKVNLWSGGPAAGIVVRRQ